MAAKVTTIHRPSNPAATRAVTDLPPDQLFALWHSAVEGTTTARLATLLEIGITEAAATLAHALTALRAGYIAGLAEPTPDCRWTRDGLLALASRRLNYRDTRRTVSHAGECTLCGLARIRLRSIDADIASFLVAALPEGAAALSSARVDTA